MKSIKIKILIPLSLSLLLGVSIFGMVFKLVQFSEKVTDYYTPSILVSDNLLETADFLSESLNLALHEGHNKPTHTIKYFKAITVKFNQVMLPFHEDEDHFNFQLSQLPHQALLLLEQNKTSEAIKILGEIVILAQENSDRHTLELEQAKKQIQIFSKMIGGLSLLVIFLGLYFTWRERKLSHARQNKATAISAVEALINALEARDHYTKGHSARVACLSWYLAQQLGLSKPDCEEVKLAAIMHDIGKIGIPDQVLLKKGRLTAQEFDTIKTHPELGAKILSHTRHLDSIVPAVLLHHERPDGKGYPNGLKSEEIPLHAQIISIADAYDAMTTTRPYRKGLSQEYAFRELTNGISIQWKRELITTFLEMWQSNLNLPQKLKEAGG